MKILDFVLLACLAIWIVASLIYIFKRKKSGKNCCGCSGGCGSCTGCSKAQKSCAIGERR